MLRTLLTAAAALPLLCACGVADEPNEPTPFACRYDAPFFDGEPTTPLSIGAFDESGDFVAWTEDSTIEVVRGLQGGYMILPAVGLEPGLEDDTCVLIELKNLPDPDAPAPSDDTFQLFPGLTVVQQLSVDPVTGALTSMGLQDQIGWDPPSALPVRVEITARGRDFAARGQIDIIAGEPIPEVCQNLEKEASSPCENVLIPGIVRIEAIDEPEAIHNVCPNDGVVVRYTFAPDNPDATSCYEASAFTNLLTLPDYGQGPPRSCLEGAGIQPGATFPATRVLPGIQYCDPRDDIELELDACSTQCQAP